MADPYVKSIILVSVLLETLEEIEGTNMYKQRLKKTGNDFKKEIEKTIDKTFDGIGNPLPSTSYILEISNKLDKLI